MDDRKNRPGVMIYFDTVLPALNYLTDGQLGALFRALLLYANGGELPELDNVTGLVFEMIAPKIDYDAMKYAKSRISGRYATYCREVKRHGREPLPFTEWTSLPDNSLIPSDDRALSTDNKAVFLDNRPHLSPSLSLSPPISPSLSPPVSPSTEREKRKFSKEERRGGGGKEEEKPLNGKSASDKTAQRKKKGAGEP